MKRTFLFLLVGFLWSSSAAALYAASLYIDPARPTLHSGDSATLAVRLDVDEMTEECVNAVSAVISYPANIEPVDVSIGESIFSMWVEQPTINRDDRTITFAGGIPNGYCGRVVGDPRLSNILMKLVVMVPGFSIGSKDTGNTAEISFTDQSLAYLNDGQGTAVSVVGYPAIIAIERKPGNQLQNAWQIEVEADKLPPEAFSIILQRDEKAFSGKYYIAFNTVDKQTGIDHYEVIEESISQFGAFQWGRADAPWIVTRSPYVLKDQSLNSIVRVKAVDKAGNEYIANLIPDENMRTMSYAQIITIVVGVASLLLVCMVLIGAFIFVRRRRKAAADTAVPPASDGGYTQHTDPSLEDSDEHHA